MKSSVKKSVLILSNSSLGLFSFRRELIAELISRGYDVVAAVPVESHGEDLSKLGLKLINQEIDRRGTNLVKDARLLRDFVRIMKSELPSFVISYTIKPNVYGGIACQLCHIPYACNITGLGTAFQTKGLLSSLVALLYKVGLRNAQTVFFENSANLEEFVHRGIIRKEQACLLHGAGVNLAHFSPAPYPDDSDTTRFVFVGRVMREKGVDELFTATQNLMSEGYSCTLDVVGELEECDYSSSLARYESEGWLRYRGLQEDVRPFLAAAHCLVLPSWHEGMANTNLEAAAMGRPIITSNIPGCKEAVIDGKSGFTCLPRDSSSLFDSMRKFIQLDWKSKSKMGLIGRKHMENMFDKKAVVNDTISRLGL